MSDRRKHFCRIGFLPVAGKAESRSVTGGLRAALGELVVPPRDDAAGNDENENSQRL